MACSVDCDRVARHRFDNDSEFEVDCMWVDYDGKEACYATVLPGVSHIQETYTTHPWRLRRKGTGELLGQHVGPDATLTVLADGSFRVEAGLRPRTPPEVRVEPWGVYRKRGQCARGLGIYAFDCVPESAVTLAMFTLDWMMAGIPEPAVERMRGWGSVLAIIGRDQVTTDIPQYAPLRGKPSGNGGGRMEDATRGIGGNLGNPVSSVGEENLTMVDDHGYGCESILIHEWAHAVMDIGYAEQPLQREIADCWKAAKKRGTYVKGSYIIKNPGEYWAEATQAWFDATVRDDVTSGLKTREAVKRADPWLASLLTRVYGDGPWRYWHTSPLPFTGDEARWEQGRAMGVPSPANGGRWPGYAPAPAQVPWQPSPMTQQAQQGGRQAQAPPRAPALDWKKDFLHPLASFLKRL